MEFPRKQLLVVGDRVLITVEDGDDRTRVGLYLPATAIDAQQVQTGLIVATGPGTPIADLGSLDEQENLRITGRKKELIKTSGTMEDRRARKQEPRHAGARRRSRDLLPQGRRRDLLRGEEVPRGAAGRDPRPDPRRPPDLTSVLSPFRREPADAE